MCVVKLERVLCVCLGVNRCVFRCVNVGVLCVGVGVFVWVGYESKERASTGITYFILFIHQHQIKQITNIKINRIYTNY